MLRFATIRSWALTMIMGLRFRTGEFVLLAFSRRSQAGKCRSESRGGRPAYVWRSKVSCVGSDSQQ